MIAGDVPLRRITVYREGDLLYEGRKKYYDGAIWSSGEDTVGRDSPNFFIRLRRVLGFIPNRVAAPSGP